MNVIVVVVVDIIMIGLTSVGVCVLHEPNERVCNNEQSGQKEGRKKGRKEGINDNDGLAGC